MRLCLMSLGLAESEITSRLKNNFNKFVMYIDLTQSNDVWCTQVQHDEKEFSLR